MKRQIALPLLLITACAPAENKPSPHEEQQSGALEAVALLKPTPGNVVEGIVSFRENDRQLSIVVHVTGLETGKHGWHIQEAGTCDPPEAEGAGSHFNPKGSRHGAPGSPEHHTGDLGNLEADANGVAHLEISIDLATLPGGPGSLLGRAIVVRSGEDDLRTDPGGGAGKPVTCGIIELARPMKSPSEGSRAF